MHLINNSKDANSCSAGRQTSRLSFWPEVHYSVHKNLSLNRILCQLNPRFNLIPYLKLFLHFPPKTHLSIPRSSPSCSWYYILCGFRIYIMRATWSAHLIHVDLITYDTWQRVQILKSLITSQSLSHYEKLVLKAILNEL